MTPRIKALSVHLLTASGAVFAMLAMLAAVDAKWSLMFLWLVVAFAVDGIDGPLARKYDVKKNAALYKQGSPDPYANEPARNPALKPSSLKPLLPVRSDIRRTAPKLPPLPKMMI